MARNRMIKPEFWSSETLMRVSLQSRLTFIGVWNFCDDYGFCLDNDRSLLGDIFPLDPNINEKKLREWIKELIQEKLLIPITYKNKRLLFVKGWGEHQTVQHKSKRSHVESCDLEQVIKDSLKSHESLVSIYLDSHAPKRKKKEKEEREIEKAKASSEDEIISFCLETGLLKSDGEYYWQHWISNGWMNNGKPIKDWRACIRKWKNLNYCPSQKNQQSNDQDLF